MQTVFNQTRMASSAGSDLASSLIKHPVAMLTTVVILLTIDPLYTLGALVVFPLCILPVLMISKKSARPAERKRKKPDS